LSLLAENIFAISKNNKLLAKSLEKCDFSDEVEIVSSKQGSSVIKYKDNFLASKYNPHREASRLYEEVKNKEANYLFIFGLPNSAMAEVFSNPAPNQVFIVFEPSVYILKTLLSHCDLTSYFSKNRIYIFSDINALDNFLQNRMIPGETFDFAINSSYKKFFLTEIKNFVNIVKNVESIKSVQASTLISYGAEFARQNLLNVFNINKAAPMGKLHNRFISTPAVIVSPGPSLAKNIKYLKELKGKAIIICTAPALAVLEKWNIKPDFVNAIETQNYSYQIKKFENFLDETYLLLLSQCHEDFFNIKCKGIFSYFTAGEKAGTYLSAKNEIFNKGIFASGGSVSTDAFFASYYLGCSPIVMIGQDLAISGVRNYAMFTLEEDAKVQLDGSNVVVGSEIRRQKILEKKDSFFKDGPRKQIVETKGLFVKKIKSKTDYFTFKAWFENTARNILGRELINATEGGVFLEGFKHLPLSVVVSNINLNCDNFVNMEIFDNVFSKFMPADNNEIIEFIMSEKIVFKNIKTNSEKLYDGYKKALNLIEKGREKEADYALTKVFRKQDEFSKKVGKLTVLESYLEEDLLKMALIQRNIKSIEKNDILRNNMHFLTKTKEAAIQILEIIEIILNKGKA